MSRKRDYRSRLLYVERGGRFLRKCFTVRQSRPYPERRSPNSCRFSLHFALQAAVVRAESVVNSPIGPRRQLAGHQRHRLSRKPGELIRSHSSSDLVHSKPEHQRGLFCRHAASTRPITSEAETPSASHIKNSVSTVGKFRFRSSWLMYRDGNRDAGRKQGRD